MQQFDQIAAFVGEGKDRSATRIVAKACDDFGMQSVEGLAHVTGLEREKDTQAAGECQHGRRRKVRSSTASGSAAREGISIVDPHGRMTRNAAVAAGADDGGGGGGGLDVVDDVDCIRGYVCSLCPRVTSGRRLSAYPVYAIYATQASGFQRSLIEIMPSMAK